MNASAFPVVGIGASAGGLDAFHKFFDHMPADCGMAFVMILHLPPDRKSTLADILENLYYSPNLACIVNFLVLRFASCGSSAADRIAFTYSPFVEALPSPPELARIRGLSTSQ